MQIPNFTWNKGNRTKCLLPLKLSIRIYWLKPTHLALDLFANKKAPTHTHTKLVSKIVITKSKVVVSMITTIHIKKADAHKMCSSPIKLCEVWLVKLMPISWEIMQIHRYDCGSQSGDFLISLRPKTNDHFFHPTDILRWWKIFPLRYCSIILAIYYYRRIKLIASIVCIHKSIIWCINYAVSCIVLK